jgi:hypothetical protein
MDIHRESEIETIRIKNHTKIFASMCPDEILDYYNSFDTRSYYTTLMLGDISGKVIINTILLLHCLFLRFLFFMGCLEINLLK